MTVGHIDFNRPTLVGSELQYVADAVNAARTAGDGPFAHRCEALLRNVLGASRVLLTTSCTHALELAALLLDLRAGDEVIVPAFTFVSTANAFALRGAHPVFADIRPDTQNLDERLVETLVTPRTRAIVPVHYAGVGCEMDALLKLAERHKLSVVEDNAHGLFGRYRGRSLGSFGALAAQSFHETKNVFCGEGGALVLNDPGFVERAEILREKGTDRSRFFRGEIDKYTWVDVGSSYVISDILAAFLFGQLEMGEHIQARRRGLWERYNRELADWCSRHDVRRPCIPPHCEQAHHMFYMVLPTPEARNGLIAHLKTRDVHAVFHYLPLHLSPMGRRFGGREGQCPVAEAVSQRLVRLPFYTGMSAEEQQRVIESVDAFNV